MYVEPIETEITKLRDENMRKDAALADSNAKLEDTRAELTDTKAELTGAKAELTDIKAELEESKAENAQLKQLLKILRGSAPSAQLS